VAWTTEKTWTTGNVLPAADLNTYLRDNSTYLYNNVVNPPGAKSYRTTDFPIAGSTWESHQLDNQDYDTDGISNTGTGTFTIQSTGTYLCIGTCMFANNATGIRQIRLNKNSGTIFAQASDGGPSSSENNVQNVVGIQRFGIGDTLICEVWQNSGGSLSMLASNAPVGYSLSVAWLGDY
jgi:hypothetical protein